MFVHINLLGSCKYINIYSQTRCMSNSYEFNIPQDESDISTIIKPLFQTTVFFKYLLTL